MTKKRIGMTLGAVLLSGLMAVVVFRPTPVPVEVMEVSRGRVEASVVAEGQTRLLDRFTVAAPVSGRLQRIELREGRLVKRGDVVARLDPIPDDRREITASRAQLQAAQARQSQAEAELGRARSALGQSEREAVRQAKLAAAGAVSVESRERADLDAATARQEVDRTQAAVRAATADVDAARAALIGGGKPTNSDAVWVYSPIDGRVVRVVEKSDRVVSAGDALIEIGNPAQLEVVIDLLSQDAAQTKSGDDVSFTNWGGEAPLHGKVRLVEPAGFTKVSALGVEEQRVNVIADILDAPASLGAAFRVEARIVTWVGEGVLTVPTNALFRDGEEWRIFVVQDGLARRRIVKVGHRSTTVAEALEGVIEGDRVIQFPTDLIAEGVRVHTTESGVPRE